MEKRNTVFGSKSEEELYKSINSFWSKNYNIYPSLPFSSIINFPRENSLVNNEKEFLYKTSIDYTLCNKKNNEPILSIDFDGLCHGFNKDGRYLPLSAFDKYEDGKRKWGFDLKLKLTEEANYPYFIVSYDEKMPIGMDVNLTILDGIIGCYLEKINITEKINNYANYHKDVLENLEPSLREDFVYDHVIIPAEVEAELEFNPISKLSWDYEVKVLDKGIKYKDIIMELPKLPDLPDAPFYSEGYLEALEKRVKNWKNIIKFGCTCEITLENGDIIFETAWIRNFDSINAIGLCRNISKLIAFKKLEELGKI